MRGEPNTRVNLTIMRRDENRTFTVTIVRQEIRTQSVRGRVIEPGYAWLRVSQFQERTVEDFARRLEAIYKEQPDLKGLVLDLRNDPGGLLDAAVALSAAFLPDNVVVVTTNGQLAESQSTYLASPRYYLRRASQDPIRRLTQATNGIYKTVPLVVLVNEGSASASEIVAGALQDHQRATIMGSQTFGKGSVQTLLPLGPETGIKLTTARYYTPNGRSIQAKGIVPDVWLDETAEGNVLAALRTREADLTQHLGNDPAREPTEAEKEALRQREQEREQARQRHEEEQRRNPGQLVLPEFGSEQDFQLQQALNQLKGKPVMVSKTAAERPEASSDAN
jgi:carboxyl-terminal processing protease